MQKQIKILGVASIVFGVIAAVIWMLPYGWFLSLPAGFLGMVVSTIYIFMDMKYEINTKKITPGIIGIALSSIPILIILIVTIISRFN